MIAGIFHEGSGLGNQLFRYITVRTLAEEKGYGWGMKGRFKGDGFLPTIAGCTVPEIEKWPFFNTQFTEKKIVENGIDIRSYDPEINFISDNTIIDGEFQDERYWGHRLNDIDGWLATEYLPIDRNTCIINFRGGEYTLFPDLFLTKEYWDTAIAHMRRIEPNMVFEVHTDDPANARLFFPDFPIVDNAQISHSNHTNMGLNWRAIRYAPYLILSNTSFAILPALLNRRAKEIVAPRYWARRNTGVWATPQNYYKRFTYL